jgi:hypothetical protein
MYKEFGRLDLRFYLGSDIALSDTIAEVEFIQRDIRVRFFPILCTSKRVNIYNYLFHSSNDKSTHPMRILNDKITMTYIIGIFEDYVKARTANLVRLDNGIEEFRFYPPRNETFKDFFQD